MRKDRNSFFESSNYQMSAMGPNMTMPNQNMGMNIGMPQMNAASKMCIRDRHIWIHNTLLSQIGYAFHFFRCRHLPKKESLLF